MHPKIRSHQLGMGMKCMGGVKVVSVGEFMLISQGQINGGEENDEK